MSNSGGGAGYSGIVNWINSGSGTGIITGAYRSQTRRSWTRQPGSQVHVMDG